jgi:hypothetical protein
MSRDITVNIQRAGGTTHVYSNVAMQLDTMSQTESAYYGGTAPYARPFPTIYSEHLPVMSAALIFDSPYALRRNYGFSGMTDSLGRTFTSDPGIFYAEDALIEDRDWIKKNFQKNVNAALRELTKRDAIAASDAAVATSSIPGVP